MCLHEVAMFSFPLGGHFRRSKLKSKIQRHCYPRLKTEMERKTPRIKERRKNTTMRPKMKYTSEFSYRISQLLSSLTRLHNVTRLPWHAQATFLVQWLKAMLCHATENFSTRYPAHSLTLGSIRLHCHINNNFSISEFPRKK